MTSAPVANLGNNIQLATNNTNSKVEANQELFFSMMQSQMYQPQAAMPEIQAKTEPVQKTELPKAEKPMEEPLDGGRIKQVKEEPKEVSELTEEETEAALEKLPEAEKKIVKAIAELLDVSEEDIEKALETLGLTMVDLAEPMNLVALTMELTDQTEPLQLLTMDGFKELTTFIQQTVTDLSEQTNIPVEILSQMEKMSEAEVLTDIAEPVQFETVLQNKTNEAEPIAEKKQEVTSEPEDYEPKAEVQEEDRPVIKAQENAKDSNEESDNGQDAFSDKPKMSDTAKPVTDNTVAEATDKPVFTVEHNRLNEISAPVQETELESPVDMKSVIDQIVEQTKSTVSADMNQIEMILNPESLGKVLLNVSSTKEGNITAHLTAQNETTKELLETQMIELKETMVAAGMKVTAIEVSVASHEFERNLEQNAESFNQQQMEQEERNSDRRQRNINLNDADGLAADLNEDEILTAKIMMEQGNRMNLTV